MLALDTAESHYHLSSNDSTRIVVAFLSQVVSLFSGCIDTPVVSYFSGALLTAARRTLVVDVPLMFPCRYDSYDSSFRIVFHNSEL